MDTRIKRFATASIVFVGIVAGVFTVSGTEKLATYEGRSIVEAVVENGDVSYSYVDRQIVGLIDPKEVLEKRNESSYTLKVSEDTFSLHAFSGRAFFENGKHEWFLLSYATTTEKGFKEKLDKPLFGNSTIVRAADFSSVGDGHITYQGSVSWDDTHDAVTGTSIVTSSLVNTTQSVFTSPNWIVSRAYFNFDTSSIPDGSSVVYGHLELRGSLLSSAAGTRDFALVEFRGASSTVPSTADYDLVGSAINNPAEGASRLTITTLGNFRYVFNSTGRSWIKDANDTSSCGTNAGVTCLGIRTGWLDADDVAPTDTTQEVRLDFWTSENAIADPLLVVFYEDVCDPYTTRCTDIFAVPGYNTWTAPTDVTSADVACWGGGGGGGVISGSGGGGGGGGAFASSTVTVAPGSTYGIQIGSGGVADSATEGGDSNFASTTVVADGGAGTTGSAGAAGGTTADSTGTTEFAGGAGGTGETTNDVGGGGGGAGGPAGAGNAGQSRISTDTVGGDGGAGNNGLGGAGGAGGNAAIGDAGGSHTFGGGGGGGGDNGLRGGPGGVFGGGGGGSEVVGIVGGSAYGGSGGCLITYMAVLRSFSPIIWFD